MKIPTQEKGPQSFVDENQRAQEFSSYTELYKSAELRRDIELHRTDELQTPKMQTPQNRKKKAEEQNVRLLSQYVAGITAVVVTAATVALIPPSPTFAIDETEIGLNSFECDLDIENAEELTLSVLLTTENGEILSKEPLNADMVLSFDDLMPETSYTVLVQDEEGEEHFAYPFTTDPFVIFTPLEDDSAARITLHESISMQYDLGLYLFDAEGKDFSSNVYPVFLDDGSTDSSEYDSTTDPPPEIQMEYYLHLGGLYTGDYTFQVVQYLPNDEQITYEKEVTLGNLTPLVYEAILDNALGQVSLQYRSGDRQPYQEFSIDLYQGDTYFFAEATVDEQGNITFPISPDWEPGVYQLYIYGLYELDGNYFGNQIWKCEITI